MRMVVYGGAVSLDGYLAREDGGVDWLVMSPDVMEIMKDMWPRFDAMVMGRKTFEFASSQGGDPGLYGDMRVVVFSRTLEPGTAGGMEFVNTDAAEFVGRMKQEDGKDIMVMGGGDLARSLFNADVIDEVGLNIHPVLLGSGLPAFHRLDHAIKLELTGSRPLSGGCLYATYSVNH